MAIALQHSPVRCAAGSREAGPLVRLLQGLPARTVRAWRRRRAARELEGLSYDQRKDIGFRSSDRAAG